MSAPWSGEGIHATPQTFKKITSILQSFRAVSVSPGSPSRSPPKADPAPMKGRADAEQRPKPIQYKPISYDSNASSEHPLPSQPRPDSPVSRSPPVARNSLSQMPQSRPTPHATRQLPQSKPQPSSSAAQRIRMGRDPHESPVALASPNSGLRAPQPVQKKMPSPYATPSQYGRPTPTQRPPTAITHTTPSFPSSPAVRRTPRPRTHPRVLGDRRLRL
ncbi:hypothetical protein J8273_2691 [Carpediemonas membranifera]|uniref:Uncharacterized protein n=1 Tax=Carpediemonas membranifera TaxID=201153 RepID=A0A8J6B7B7_9EUKA|nr:hypothetical protein J8273_2691 [Carpediemonas membranifera]|eukprot:KAG9395779.1 hypothetical protein J8273_2691 [Carpediemonas membranifera]